MGDSHVVQFLEATADIHEPRHELIFGQIIIVVAFTRSHFRRQIALLEVLGDLGELVRLFEVLFDFLNVRVVEALKHFCFPVELLYLVRF